MSYSGLLERASKADRRLTTYQFDLERDVCWDRIDEPGAYIPRSFVSDLGIPMSVLDGNPEAGRMFQWAYALSICETFSALENLILWFAESETGTLPRTRSLALLCDEERKHTALFDRFAAHLRRSNPAGALIFQSAYRETKLFWDRLRSLPRQPHYRLWLLTTFIEEFTIYFDQRLQVEPRELQPTWVSLHAAHRQEEVQHLVTDMIYIDSEVLAEEERLHWSQIFLAGLAQSLGHFCGYAPAILSVGAAYPALTSIRPPMPVTRTPFFNVILSAPEFKRTRKAAPAFAEYESLSRISPPA